MTNRIAAHWDPESDLAVQHAERPAPGREPRWSEPDESWTRAEDDRLAMIAFGLFAFGTIGFVLGWVTHGMVH